MPNYKRQQPRLIKEIERDPVIRYAVVGTDLYLYFRSGRVQILAGVAGGGSIIPFVMDGGFAPPLQTSMFDGGSATSVGTRTFDGGDA
jgi:hypothetical protein